MSKKFDVVWKMKPGSNLKFSDINVVAETPEQAWDIVKAKHGWMSAVLVTTERVDHLFSGQPLTAAQTDYLGWRGRNSNAND